MSEVESGGQQSDVARAAWLNFIGAYLSMTFLTIEWVNPLGVGVIGAIQLAMAAGLAGIWVSER